MNYKKIYNSLIQKAKSENRIKYNGIYYESHHIIPKCLGGDGFSYQWKFHSNIVLLTAREHFLAHWLLCRIYSDNKKILNSFWRMTISRSSKNSKVKITSRMYEEAKLNKCKANSEHKGRKFSKESLLKCSIAQKEKWKKLRAKGFSFKGENNPMFGKKVTQEHKDKISKANKGNKAWNKGLKVEYNFTEEGKRKMREASKSKTAGKIIAYKYPSMEFVNEFYNIKQAEEKLNVGNIGRVIAGKSKQAKGYFFERDLTTASIKTKLTA